MNLHCIYITFLYSLSLIAVSMTPGDDFGAVQVWMDDTYRMVCAEGFDDIDATVACRNMGYGYGKSLCCSAFGDIDFQVRMLSSDRSSYRRFLTFIITHIEGVYSISLYLIIQKDKSGSNTYKGLNRLYEYMYLN